MPISIYKIKTFLKHPFEMEKSTITLTRKIQLLLDLPANEQKEMWEKLYRYQNRCFRAANFIVSHLYVQEMIKISFTSRKKSNTSWLMQTKMKWESSTVRKQTPPHESSLTDSKGKFPPISWEA